MRAQVNEPNGFKLYGEAETSTSVVWRHEILGEVRRGSTDGFTSLSSLVNPLINAYVRAHGSRTSAMLASTLFLGKLLGLYLVVVSLAMLVSRRRALAAIDEIVASEAWMLFSGLVATAVGLAVVIAHNVWSGGALTVAITLAGWAALLKGLSLLFVPPGRIAATYRSAGFERYFRVWMGVVLVFGLWMAMQAFGG